MIKIAQQCESSGAEAFRLFFDEEKAEDGEKESDEMEGWTRSFVHKTAATGLQSKGEKHWRGHYFDTTGGHKAKAKLLLLLLETFY